MLFLPSCFPPLVPYPRDLNCVQYAKKGGKKTAIKNIPGEYIFFLSKHRLQGVGMALSSSSYFLKNRIISPPPPPFSLPSSENIPSFHFYFSLVKIPPHKHKPPYHAKKQELNLRNPLPNSSPSVRCPQNEHSPSPPLFLSEKKNKSPIAPFAFSPPEKTK